MPQTMSQPLRTSIPLTAQTDSIIAPDEHIRRSLDLSVPDQQECCHVISSLSDVPFSAAQTPTSTLVEFGVTADKREHQQRCANLQACRALVLSRYRAARSAPPK